MLGSRKVRIVVLGALVALIVPASAHAAAIAPAPSYYSSNFTSSSFTAVGTTAIVGSSVDDGVVSVTLPFDFTYMGVTYLSGSALHVSTNGNISFDTTVDPHASTDYTSSCPLPDSVHGSALFPLWQDLDSSGSPSTEGIYTAVTGSAPYRTLNIEWRTQQHLVGVAGDVHFEVQLFETLGTIEFRYPAVNGAGASAVVGIQQGSTAGDAMRTYECHTGGITTNKVVEFIPSTPSVEGTAEQGLPLTAGNNAFTGSPAPTVTDQWERCDGAGLLSSCSDIAGATSNTYGLTADDVGHELRVRATATNASGSVSSVSAPSNVVLPVPAPAPTYTVSQTGGATIVPGVTDNGNNGDDVATSVTLPFTVNFYGTPYTSAYANSNGSLEFGTLNNSYTSNCLANDVGANSIEAYQMDLDTTPAGSGVFTTTTGAAPHRQFFVEWRAAYHVDMTMHANFEIVLHEDSPVVSVIYGASSDSGLTAVAGIEHDIGTIFNQFSCSAASLTPGTQVNYAPSQPAVGGTAQQGSTLSVTPATFTGRTPLTITDQWQRCDTDGANCGDIPGATAQSYVPGVADVGHTLRDRETATNSDGSGSSESQPTAVVKVPTPPNNPPPNNPPPATAVLSKLTLSPASLHAASSGGSTARATGTKVSYKLNVAANVRFTIERVSRGRLVHHKCVRQTHGNRHKSKCTSVKLLSGSFTIAGVKGANSVHFTGRLAGHALKPGSYILIAQPTGTTHKVGRSLAAPFTIIR